MIMFWMHDLCGAVVMGAFLGPLDPDGTQHLCRDYVAWHLPPDRRDPLDLDVPDGWRPTRVLRAA